jgi:hypothetical protein
MMHARTTEEIARFEIDRDLIWSMVSTSLVVVAGESVDRGNIAEEETCVALNEVIQRGKSTVSTPRQ